MSSFTTTDPELYSASGFLKHTGHDDVKLMALSKTFIRKCVWESEDTHRECTVNITVTPTNGLCYTIHPPAGEGQQVRTRLEGISVILFLNNINLRFVPDYRMSPFHSYTEGVKVMLHPQGTFPNMGKGFTVAPGNEASMVASYTKRELRPHPYGDCQQNLKLDMFENIRAENVWHYTEYACTSLCYQSKILEECGCLDSTEVTFHDLVMQHRFCSIYSLVNPEKALSEMNCTRRVKRELDDKMACTKKCPKSCNRDSYKNSINEVRKC
jgi:acid-sensing ion channel 5